MNLKPTRLNPTNISPCARTREPLRDIINLNRLPTPKENASTRKISYTESLYPRPRIQPIDLQSSIGQKSRSQRHSLRPLQEEELCGNHSDKTAKFKVVSEEIDLFYCQKCAILLASQGFKVERLTSLASTPSSSRLRIGSSFSSSQQPTANNKYINESYMFVGDVNTFLQKCQQIKSNNRQERQRVLNYYSSITKQIDEFQEQLKTSISIMMQEQRQDIQLLFEELDRKFNLRCSEIQAAQSELSSIVLDITENIHTIGMLSEAEFIPAINKYRLALDEATKRIQTYSDLQRERLELLNPKAQNLKHLADIIGECRYKLRTHKKTESSPTTLQQPNKPTSMFFSFHKMQSKQERSSRMSDLDANVNVIMTNSDSEGEDGREFELQQSIVDPDFSRLVNGG